ncbi:MAG: nickel-responsive transcriptional regulator NikR [Haloarculaceae archaeon]
MTDHLDRMSITLPEQLMADLNDVVEGLDYDSRSEATRDALRQFITDYKTQTGLEGTRRGTVVMLYDHDVKGVTDEVLELQHEFNDTIVAVQHVHLSHHLCLETLVVDGPGEDIEALLNRLRSLTGVHQIRLAVVEAED